MRTRPSLAAPPRGSNDENPTYPASRYIRKDGPAALAHQDQDGADQFRIRRLIEDAAGHPLGISTSCGLGRRPPAAGLAALDQIKLLPANEPAG